MAEKLRLTKTLNRYKKEELVEDVPILLGFETSRLPEEKLLAGIRRTKRELVSSLVGECFERNISDVDILDLELQCKFNRSMYQKICANKKLIMGKLLSFGSTPISGRACCKSLSSPLPTTPLQMWHLIPTHSHGKPTGWKGQSPPTRQPIQTQAPMCSANDFSSTSMASVIT